MCRVNATLAIPTLEEIKREKLRRKLEGSLFQFTLWVFAIIYKRKFLINWHHRTLCQILEDIHAGNLLHTVINIPPRYTKTEIVVKIFTAWSFAKNPGCEFINLAYSDDLALANSSAVREIISHEAFQELWPLEFKKDSQAKKKWKTMANGEMSATGSGGAVTGFGAGKLGSEVFAGAMIVDDPLKPEDSNSDTVRNSINNRFPQTLKSRLNDRRTPMIIIMQRLHEDDPAGFLLDGGTELEFTHICLPAINEDGPSKYDLREIGEPLWPAKHDAEELEEMRLSDALGYAGQYQQRPAPAEGNIWKEEYVQFYTRVPADLNYKCHSWDMTFKEKSKTKGKKTDFVVGGELARQKGTNNIYLLPDLVRARMGFDKTLDAVKIFIENHPDFKALLIEDKANGSGIISMLKKEGTRRVIEVEPNGTKMERLQSQIPLFKAGNIFFPDPSIAPWINDFIQELKVFPNGKNDDQVDMLTQGVQHLDELGISSMSDVNKKTDGFGKVFEKDKHYKRKERIKVKHY